MTLQWSKGSYLSWKYEGHRRRIIPVTNFEIDIRTKYIFRFHTRTLKYSSIYDNNERQLIIRREPIAEDADDRYILKIKFYDNQTFLIHLQVINNHYVLIGEPDNENFSWKLHGYFQRDQFNGSLSIFNNDWWLSSKFNFNSSLYISTGRYVQLNPTLDPQIAFEILLKYRLHFAFQYSGLYSLIALKIFHNSSNINLYFSSKSINKTQFDIVFQLNNLINQSWIFNIKNEHFTLYNHNYEFIFNGSLQDFSFQHSINNKTNKFFINKNTIQFQANNFGLIISNLSTDTTRYIHLYHRLTKENLTINYYKYGRFFKDDYTIQTPIYDISLIYHPTDNKNRFVKIILELLPLQMSSFNFVRGRSFRIGYQTEQKRLILSGNIAFTIEDIYNRHIIIMNERWKLIYGMEKRNRIYLKWDMKVDLNKRTLRGRMSLQDPNNDMSTPIYSDIHGHLDDKMIETTILTSYSSSKNSQKLIQLQLNVNKRILNQQYITLKLIHNYSNTNLCLKIVHYPKRKLHIYLKPNHFSREKTFIHLYGNTTRSQLNLILIFANLIDFNLKLPKSYPDNGLLHSSLFIQNEEYFDGRLDTKALRFRSKEYTGHIKLNQFILKKKIHKQILASIFTRWFERNSSTVVITIFNKIDFKRVRI